MFKITVVELTGQHMPSDQPEEIKRYEQIVDALDLPAVMAAVNRKPRAPRKSRAKDVAA